MQNKIIRASLFCHKRTLIGNLYVNFHVLKLSDLIKLEYVKFMYRFENNLLPVSFKKYFTNLDCCSVPKNRPNYVDSQSHKKYL